MIPLKFSSLRWALLGSSLLLGGCGAFQTLEPEAIPAAVPTPLPDLFDPADGITPGLTKLNDNAPDSALLPDAFRVARVDSGEILALQSVSSINSGGTPPKMLKTYGTTDAVRLAGIVTPAPGQPGFQATVAKIQSWTLGQEVDVEQDPRFPVDFQNRRMVQVFFTGREGKLKGQKLLLNRMLVRLGFAVVDINAPTTIDVKPWLNDESFAREKGLGLWGMGITLGQRIPLRSADGRPQRPLIPPVGSVTSGDSGTAISGGDPSGSSSAMPSGSGGPSNSASPSASGGPSNSASPNASGGPSNSASPSASGSGSGSG